MGAIKAPYTVTIEITEDADGWHLPTSEEYERRRMTREFIVKEYQTFPYKGAMYEMPELIRCKDCKYYRKDGDCWHEWDNDGRIYYQSIINEPNPDDYCSRAERREE